MSDTVDRRPREVQMIQQNTEDLFVTGVPSSDAGRFAGKELWLQGAVLAWAFAAFYIYTLQVIVPGYRMAFVLFGQILNGTATSPYPYRVLVPFLIKGLSAPLSGILKPQTAFLVCYTAFCLAAIEFSALVVFRMLRLWFDAMASLAGVLMFCLMVAVAAHHDTFQPWSQLEPGLYAAAIMLGARRSSGWALLLTIVASFNRETGVFVPLLFCAALPGTWFDRKRIFWLAVHAFVEAWIESTYLASGADTTHFCSQPRSILSSPI